MAESEIRVWQGYRDHRFLRRVLFYVAWLLLNQGLPVFVTIVYLKPGDDTGDTLRQELDGRECFTLTFHVVRLWEQDAGTAIASGLPGLAVHSALMAGSGRAAVEAAAGVIVRAEPDPAKQASLLGILGVFAKAFITPEQLERILGRERLMESKLLEHLMREKTAEIEQKMGAERAERGRAQLSLGQAVEEAMIARFPDAPLALVTSMREIRDPDQLLRLNRSILSAPD